jgi:uridine kinase
MTEASVYPVKVRSLAAYVAGNLPEKRPFLIGIDGLAGAGKTTFCTKLVPQLRDKGLTVKTVSLDDSYWTDTPREISEAFHRSEKNFAGEDYDWRRLKLELLLPIQRGSTLVNGSPSEQVVIIEGCFCLRMELRDYYDLRVFTHNRREECLTRAVERDGEGSRSYYETYWKTEEDFYIKMHDPLGSSDLIVDTSGETLSDEINVSRFTELGRLLRM